MDERDWLTQRFQEHRPRLRALAYRMLGSTSEADDALQEAWIRLSRSNASEIDNFEAWLGRRGKPAPPASTGPLGTGRPRDRPRPLGQRSHSLRPRTGRRGGRGLLLAAHC